MNTEAQKPDSTISVFAGNPLLTKLEDGELIIDPHLEAFEEAMKFVGENRERISKVYVAFDHIGRFDKQFIADGATSKQKKKPTVANLLPEIRERYEEIAARYDVPLSEVAIITEGSARMAMLNVVKAMPADAPLRKAATRKTCENGSCSTDNRLTVNCAGIVAEIYRRLGLYGDEIRSFWEYDDKRCKPETIDKGIKIAKEMLDVRAKVADTIMFSEEDGGGTLERKY